MARNITTHELTFINPEGTVVIRIDYSVNQKRGLREDLKRYILEYGLHPVTGLPALINHMVKEQEPTELNGWTVQVKTETIRSYI